MLVEWHLTPEYILDNWTDEEFALMVEKLVERKKRQAGAAEDGNEQRVSDSQLFAMSSHLGEVK